MATWKLSKYLAKLKYGRRRGARLIPEDKAAAIFFH